MFIPEKSGGRESANCEMSAEPGQGLFRIYKSAKRMYNALHSPTGISTKKRAQLGETPFTVE